jgi:hypothetical protein
MKQRHEKCVRPADVEHASVGQAHAAGSAGQRVIDAAKKTTGEVLPRGGDQRSTERSTGKLPVGQAQPARAASSGVSVRTQRKLDALARQAPALLARVQDGELSARRAWAEKGKSHRRATPGCLTI